MIWGNITIKYFVIIRLPNKLLQLEDVSYFITLEAEHWSQFIRHLHYWNRTINLTLARLYVCQFPRSQQKISEFVLRNFLIFWITLDNRKVTTKTKSNFWKKSPVESEKVQKEFKKFVKKWGVWGLDKILFHSYVHLY